MSTRHQVLGSTGQGRPLRPLELSSWAVPLRPRFPVSPPETERSAPIHTSPLDHKVPVTSTHDGEKEREESTIRHLRRTQSVQYNQVPMNPRPQQSKAPRWLLVVLPPASCLEGDPTLGHTLAMGPPSRLRSGVLMPLFSTVRNSYGRSVSWLICLFVDVRPADRNCERIQFPQYCWSLPLFARL